MKDLNLPTLSVKFLRQNNFKVRVIHSRLHKVIDSFDKVIGDTVLENLLVDLINVIKPAHTESSVVFEE